VANRLYTWIEPEKVTKVFKPWLLEDSDDENGKNKGKIGVDNEEGEKKKKPRERKYEHIMFLGHMGIRRLWYRAMCGMCNRKMYWETYLGTLNKVEKDMKKQMDIV
jgi:hypothetical protein